MAGKKKVAKKVSKKTGKKTKPVKELKHPDYIYAVVSANGPHFTLGEFSNFDAARDAIVAQRRVCVGPALSVVHDSIENESQDLTQQDEEARKNIPLAELDWTIVMRRFGNQIHDTF